MERILIGLCVLLSGATFTVEGLCSDGNQMQMSGVWMGVLNEGDTGDWIGITQNDTVYVDVRDIEAKYVCEEENQYGSAYLWMTSDGSGYLCVYRVDIMDDVVQYSLLTNSGEFAPKDLPEGVGHTFASLCVNTERRPALDIRRFFEHQLQA